MIEMVSDGIDSRIKELARFLDEHSGALDKNSQAGSDISLRVREQILGLSDEELEVIQKIGFLRFINQQKGDLEKFHRVIDDVTTFPSVYIPFPDRILTGAEARVFYYKVRGNNRADYKKKKGEVYSLGNFLAAIVRDRGLSQVIDFCSGRGYLTTYLAFILPDVNVIGIEKDPKLIERARKYARELKFENIRYDQGDIRSNVLDGFASLEHTLGVGLHTCGELAHVVLEHAVHSGLDAIADAPCCSTTIEPNCRPKSKYLAQLEMRITPELLALTALSLYARNGPGYELRRRAARKVNNLALVLILSEELGIEHVPNIEDIWKEMNKHPFSSYIRDVLPKKDPKYQPLAEKHIDFDAYLERAKQIYRKQIRYDLFRSLFTKAVESLINLDEAVWLREQGFRRAGVLEFMPRHLTARNQVIVGYR